MQIFVVFDKFTCADQHQLALEIMFLLIQKELIIFSHQKVPTILYLGNTYESVTEYETKKKI